MPPPSNAPVRRWVIVILIALPVHTVKLTDVAVAPCAGDLSDVTFAVRGSGVVGTLPSGVEAAVLLGNRDENHEAVQQVPCRPRARTSAPSSRYFAWEAAALGLDDHAARRRRRRILVHLLPLVHKPGLELGG